MKVGTDGVLLGAWTPLRDSDRRILDIGTGTGLIALMLAQRAPGAAVTGIDIDDVGEARANGDASPWGDRLSFVRCPVQEFSDRPFDLIVSNPPFFVDSLTCPDAGRTTASRNSPKGRWTACRTVVRLLAADGHFAVILPTTEADRFVHLCRGYLQPVRRTDVRTTPRRPVKRALLEFVPAGVHASDPASGAPLRDELTIGTGEHECYTPEYRALTCDFYLKF